jgi:lactoylglutathione lyase
MKLAQIAIWARDLERLRGFYEAYFGGVANAKYRNEAKRFESYFLRFPDGGLLELMQRPDIRARPDAPADGGPAPECFGQVHFGLEVGTPAAVDALTQRLASAGCPVLDGPRKTGDGYYESIVADPEGNRILIVA